MDLRTGTRTRVFSKKIIFKTEIIKMSYIYVFENIEIYTYIYIDEKINFPMVYFIQLYVRMSIVIQIMIN